VSCPLKRCIKSHRCWTMSSTHDLRNLPSTSGLRTKTTHSRSTVFHFYELTVLNRPIGFALQTKSFDILHINRSPHGVICLRFFVTVRLIIRSEKFRYFSLNPPTWRRNYLFFRYSSHPLGMKEATACLFLH